MRYYHRLGDEEAVKSDSASFLLARKAGGYLSLGLPNVTRYQGLCTLLPYGESWEMLKSVESIAIDDTPESIVLLPDCAERVYRSALERFTVKEGAVLYELTHYQGLVRISLDMRFIHDFESWGRNYSIQDVPEGHVITYSCPRYSFHLAILGGKAAWKPQWHETDYSYDRQRNAKADFWINDCLEYTCNGSLNLRFGVGWSVSAAIAEANKTAPQAHLLRVDTHDPAVQAAVNDLDGLLATLPHLDLGILAGYPWFYQVWTRDEAISAGALVQLGYYKEAKQILLRQLQHLREDGRISNRFPESQVASADGVGWTFLRLRQICTAGQLNDEEAKYVHRLLEQSIRGLQQHRTHETLVRNDWKETWMDTTGGYEDGRAGYRIEIQALSLSMYAFMAELCERLQSSDADYYRRKEELLRTMVREQFYDQQSGTLADGIDDHVDRTIRPNIFIAHYAYSGLLTGEEWRRVFEVALRKLWLPWGGLSTIDQEHLLFTPQYTGETDKSYHRGDSWFFLNNLAALCLLERGFAEQAQQIYDASRTQILTMGIPGHAAEASSAKNLEGVGCYSQAWSAATFLELWARMASRHPSS